MTGYMEKIIFTRVLGSDEIEHADVWKDGSQCWVCEKWSKQRIEHEPQDREFLKQNIKKLNELDEVLEKIVNPLCHDKIEVLSKKNVQEVNKMLKLKLAKIDERSEDMRSDSKRPLTTDSEVL